MGMNIIEDLKEARKEINEIIRTMEKLQHKNDLFRTNLKNAGFSDEQLNKIQNIWDDLVKT